MEDLVEPTVQTSNQTTTSMDDNDEKNKDETRESSTSSSSTSLSSSLPSTKLMTVRLASGVKGMAEKSKVALHTAANTANHLSKKATTSATNTVKQGVQLVVSPWKEIKTDSTGRNVEIPSTTVEREDTRIPPSTTILSSTSSSSSETTKEEINKDFKTTEKSQTKHFSNWIPSFPNIVVDEDRMILWIVVSSIFFLQTIQNIHSIVYDTVLPFSVVGSWMLLAFTVGMEVDGTILIQNIKYYFLGPNSVTRNRPDSMDPMDNTTNLTMVPLESSTLKRNPIRFLHRMVSLPSTTTRLQPYTCLERSIKDQDRIRRNMQFNALLVRKLVHFGRKQPTVETLEGPSAVPSATTTTTIQDESEVLGLVNLDQSQATVLLTKMPVQPICRLRGIDIFLTDCAESEMSTHPFLLKNGLRSVPTFMINMMTQWGSILIYLELPDWVVDTANCLVENDDDPDPIKALKRFLAGNDKYRQERLKILPEFVDAPYAIRLLASKDTELQIHYDGWLETKYYIHSDGCPIWEMNLDFMGNSTIRGMASFVKRYLSSINADFALVISYPNEPQGVLGLWRFDHINVNEYPSLPDRYEGTEESSDIVRVHHLVQEASQRVLVTTHAS